MSGHFLHRDGIRVHVEGPWPFVTRLRYALHGRRIEWLARQHRKGLHLEARALDARLPLFWQSEAYNRAIGLIFAVGSLLFMLGSALSLLPLAWQPAMLWLNLIFFAGSVPFTLAAYLQHFQAANSGDFTFMPQTPRRRRLSFVGWHPRNAGWMSTITQFAGTLAFNVNTFDGVLARPGWLAQDVALWAPDMIGSVLFLVSGYLAFIETGHRYWSWHPASLAWQIVFINLIGCIAFMIAAILALALPGGEAAWIGTASTVNLLIGATCFLIGALLSVREATTQSSVSA
ncbi:hypothetical protein [Ancylobacter terrae]|uniref:hypothetical protein n=1 Tax=Ancylobacter sp. sgz301288 TaxID=3342077 RepID=UPI00385FDAF3